MNRDIAEKWIADLRTNPPQTRKALFDGNGYCCLGRLCILAGIEPETSFNGSYAFINHTGVLPQKIADWAGVKTSCAAYRGGSLVSDNDNGKTFAQIADIIEAHIDEL